MDDSKPTLLKRDATGRVRDSREQREALQDVFERSGLVGGRIARANCTVS